MLAASFYTVAPGEAHRIMDVYPRHRAYLDAFQEGSGEILLIGPFADQSGSMAIFRSREAAERFIAGDPFVLEGLVGESRIVDWPALDFTATDAAS